MRIDEYDRLGIEPDELIIPSKNGFVVLPADNLRGPEISRDRRPGFSWSRILGGRQWALYRLRYVAQLVLMVAAMVSLLAVIGFSVGGWSGLLVITAAGGIGLWVTSHWRVDAVLKQRRAIPLHPSDSYELFGMLAKLAARAGLKTTPQLYLEPREEINAYTVADREQSAIVFSNGLVRHLSPREIFGVLAHEIAHLKNGDIPLMLVSDQIRRLTSTMALAGQVLLVLYLPLVLLGQVVVPWVLLVVLMLAPLLSLLIQVAISRNREFSADLEAVALSGDPVGLALALRKIRVQTGFWKRYYAPYLKEVPELLRTHPETTQRIERLERLAYQGDGPYGWIG